MADGSIKIGVDIDSKEFMKAIKVLESQAVKTSTNVSDAFSKGFNKGLQKVEARTNAVAGNIFKAFADKVDKTNSALDKKPLKVKAKLDDSEMDKKLKEIKSKFEETKVALTSNLGKAVKGISTAIASTTVALGGLGLAVTKVGKDFEAQMSKVSAISGASAEEMELLEAKAKEMGATTQFSAKEAGEALEYMALAGFKTQDMLDSLAGVMDLAAASGEDLGLVSDIVTDGLSAFGLSAKEAGRFADVLASASANSNTNVAMLGERLAQLKVA